MKKIDRLLREAQKLAAHWKPGMIIIAGRTGAYSLTVQEWDGKPGTARDPGRRKEYNFATKEEAKRFAELVVQSYIERTKDRHFEPVMIDCCEPTDNECREAWLGNGGTVLEKMAEKSGVSLEEAIREAYGRDISPETLPVWSDILRWRKEVGTDEETASAPVNTEGSTGGADKNGE